MKPTHLTSVAAFIMVLFMASCSQNSLDRSNGTYVGYAFTGPVSYWCQVITTTSTQEKMNVNIQLNGDSYTVNANAIDVNGQVNLDYADPNAEGITKLTGVIENNHLDLTIQLSVNDEKCRTISFSGSK